VKKSQEIFKRHGYEPLALKAHDSRLLIGGYTPKVACRVVAEELFQALIDEVDIERDGDDCDIDELYFNVPDQKEAIAPDQFTLGYVLDSYVGHTVRVKDNDGNIWYGVVDTEGLALMTRSDLLPKSREGE
jgi:hypothetical protein